MLHKGPLIFRYNLRQEFLYPSGYEFCEDFIHNITKGNSFDLREVQRNCSEMVLREISTTLEVPAEIGWKKF